jgi:hypothetical protein
MINKENLTATIGWQFEINLTVSLKINIGKKYEEVN